MKHLGILLAVVGLIVGGLRAAELAPGLAYLRPGLEVTPQTGSAVLDFRYLKDVAAAAPLLAAIQPGNANEHRVILVLVSPETPAGLRRQLIGLPRCLTVGLAAPGFKTNIVVTTSPEADRRAFGALVGGIPLKELLVENANKTRFDETALIREHAATPEPANDTEVTGLTPAEAITPPAAAGAPKGVESSTVTDAVLQRAVQIHRGLTVLKKL